MVVAILVVLFALNVKLTLLALVSFPLLAIGAAWFQKLLDPVAARLQERLARGVGSRRGGRGGHPCRQGLRRRAGPERVDSTTAPSRFDAKRSRSARLRATFNPMLDLLPMVALVTVLYVGGKDAIDGTLTVGDLVAFSALLAPARVPAAHDVVRRRAGRAGVRVGRARAGSDGHRARDRRGRVAPADTAGTRGGVVLRRAVRLPRRPRRAARLRPRDRRRRVGRARRADRLRQEHGARD